MPAPKKPPPDTVGNVRGRILKLKRGARRHARMDAKNGADEERALAKHLREIEPALKKLQRRLAKARKSEGDSTRAASVAAADKKAPKRNASKSREPKADEEDDLLSKLDAL